MLAYAGRLDPRTLQTDAGEAGAQIAQWHELLGDVPFTTDHGWDVRKVVRDHYRTSPYRIAPSDIARRWETYRQDRLARHTDPTPTADPDDPTAWRAELLGARQAVASGAAPPSTLRQITGGTVRPDIEARLNTVGSCIPPTTRAELARFRPDRTAREAAVTAGQTDTLGVACPWCHAPVGKPCCRRRPDLDGRSRGSVPLATPHPSRVDKAAERLTPQTTRTIRSSALLSVATPPPGSPPGPRR